MDTVTMAIINGSMCGAASGLVTVAVPVIVNAGKEFKAMLLRKFGKDSALLESVRQLEQNPESKARKAVVEEEVEKSGAHRDEELLAAAGKLLALLKEAQPQVDARGAQIGVMGDHAKVKGGIHFGNPR